MMLTKDEMIKRRSVVINNWKDFGDKNYPITELAKQCKVTPETYRKYLREIGIEPVGQVFKYRCKRDFFKVIDTEEKAYWLGFIFADGNVSIQEKHAYILSLGLSIRDEPHLKLFKLALDTDIKIYHKKHTDPNNHSNKDAFESCRIDISSKELCRDLIDKGCIPAKSLKKKLPAYSKVPKHLYRHFLRGYFDGNGSISISNKGYITVTLASSVALIEGLIILLQKELGIRPKKIYHPKKATNDSWGIWKCVTFEATLLLKYLYHDASIYLNRKYAKYSSICGLTEKPVLKSGEIRRRLKRKASC